MNNYKKIENFLLVRAIYEQKGTNITQRTLADALNISVGKINKIFNDCNKHKLLDDYKITKKGLKLLNENKVDLAVILASGLGTRLAPLTYEIPKGLCTIYGERMIERQIQQLNSVGIDNIIIVVGYLKEKFEYLIDKYNVKLIYNKDFAIKNNLYSLYLVKKHIINKNAYILASDHWMKENIFHKFEFQPWYAAKYIKGKTKEWGLKYNKDQKITKVEKAKGNMFCMYGPAYFNKSFSSKFCKSMDTYVSKNDCADFYWEDVLFYDIKKLPPIYINKFEKDIVYEFETLDEFRNFDKSYIDNTGSFAIKYVSNVFKVREKDIKNVKPIAAGMTNKSWIFSINDKNRLKTYICRSPGKGSNILINRNNEKKCYDLLKKYDITDEIVSIDPKTGYKITIYYKKFRKLNLSNNNDIKLYVNAYSNLYSKKIKADFKFDFKRQIKFYDNLIKKNNGIIPFENMVSTNKNVNKLLNFVKKYKNKRPSFLIHVDSCVDNVLVVGNKVRIIDWEYAASGDPLIDIAMFTIYSFKDYNFAFNILEHYLKSSNTNIKKIISNNCTVKELKDLLVAYMALSAYLWTLWAIFKETKGDDYGEYELKTYKVFKDNFRYLINNNILI